jgi:hypothetical protein
VVAYGLGMDSTAMLIEFPPRGIRPDLILFADTGGEKPESYQYLDIIRPFLARVGFPDVTAVRYQPKRSACRTSQEQCLYAPICFGVSVLRALGTTACARMSMKPKRATEGPCKFLCGEILI